MIIPKPFPDECLRSYGFRINNLNSNDLSSTSQLLSEVSKNSSLSIPYLLTNHSHLAYTRFVHSSFGYLDINTHPDLFTNRNIYNLQTPIRFAQFCPNCIQDDIKLQGFPYWHRIHQLPGVDHCIIHNISLVNTNSHDSFMREPSTLLKITPCIPDHLVNSYFQFENIKKFAHLSVETLNIGLSFEHIAVKSALIHRYNNLINGSYFGSSKSIYDKFPPFWVNKLFHNTVSNNTLENKNISSPTPQSLNPSKHIKHYIILMSLLWNNPKEAIRASLFTHALRRLEDGRTYLMQNKYKQR
jgi:hypothetical protein